MYHRADDSADEEDEITTGGGIGIESHANEIRDRSKRNPNVTGEISSSSSRTMPPGSDRDRKQNRKEYYNRSATRKLPFRGRSCFHICIFVAIFVFALASMLLQSSISSIVYHQRSSHRERLIKELKFGSSLKFLPRRMDRYLDSPTRIDHLRSKNRNATRQPRLALVLGNMKKDALALMIFTIVTNLQELGYVFQIYATEDGQARFLWEKTGAQISILSPENYGHIDWLNFEGVIADSLQAKDVISSLMLEPFCSVPLIWIIQEDTLANQLPMYEEFGWNHLISHWKNAFSRADVIVFSDFSLPILYSVLDTGNFFVIPGSPIDVWAAESYSKTHSKSQLRRYNSFSIDDTLVLVVGSSFFYNELSWDYAVAMHDIGPLLVRYAGQKDTRGSFKFLFLCGNSSEGYNDALQDIATQLGLDHGSLKHCGIDSDVNSLLLMADIVLFASSQDEQGFPPLLTRAMSFGIPVIAPDYPVIKKYVHDGVEGMIFPKHKPNALMIAFSLLISDGKLSTFANRTGKAGRLRARNMFALECVTGYAKLLENVLNFPSDTRFPGLISQLEEVTWEWYMFHNEIEHKIGDFASSNLENTHLRNSTIVYDLEKEMRELINSESISLNDTVTVETDLPTVLDWDILLEMESSEEFERLEMEEMEERMEKDSRAWEDIYRDSRKAEKLKFETNERDEGELERTGQMLCIYEIYDGAGAWPFLHHGSLYRGLSLSRRERRLRSDDVDAVSRLPLLNNTYYRDILCDIGGMFAIANMVDNVHKCPWIGFQSWQTSARKVSLSTRAEQVLEETVGKEATGDVIYFWAPLAVDGGHRRGNDATFWSVCDILNGGKCSSTFGDAFRMMYALPSHINALPPMPEDGGHWSAMNSWVMPTPSFLEFIMFSRIFVDSLDGLRLNSSRTTDCILGTSMLEKRHCYCRILEILVNVWAYHSAQKMVYIDPYTGVLQEQHVIEQRKGLMWSKYFNNTLLKSMDEDLAEAADDQEYPYEKWLWPLTGEIYWKGVYDREREERYRLKEDKKRKMKDKLLDRMKHGYKQKTLG